MSRNYKKYSVEERLELLREYHQSGKSKYAFCHEHGISCLGVLNLWLKKYETGKEVLPLHPEPDATDTTLRSHSNSRSMSASNW